MRRKCTLCRQEALWAGRNPVDKLHENLNMCIKCQKEIAQLVADWNKNGISAQHGVPLLSKNKDRRIRRVMEGLENL